MDKNGLEQQHSTLAMINMLNMAQLISMASVGPTAAALPNNIPAAAAAASQAQAALANLAAGFSPMLTPFGAIGQVPLSSDSTTASTATVSEPTASTPDDERTPRTGVAFRKMLESYG
ncbi:unnamed protein product [Gongylonema pulchrum]|uniref:Polymorphic PE/PPE family protein n=1 Tax=Gongylonema pulchrum TaxID=637853 RepID=A0A183CY02_9BILA|nr:unnamed protein product [Gongylonema pulchrum]